MCILKFTVSPLRPITLPTFLEGTSNTTVSTLEELWIGCPEMKKWKVNKSSSPNLGCCANVWWMSISASWAPSGLPLWQDNYNASESVTMSTSQSNREKSIYLSNLMAATLYSSVSSSSLKLILVSVFAWNQYCIYHRFHFQRHSWVNWVDWNLDLSDVGPLSSNNKADTVFGYFHLRPVLKYS